jgi:YHS domain-containing protein
MRQAKEGKYDPICGMPLAVEQIVAEYTYFGQTYVFCSTECYEMFAQTPTTYVVFLAHERAGHYGHCCPRQRQI